MTTTHCNIAGHGLTIDFSDEGDSTLLPSFASFMTQGEDKPVLRVRVDNSFALTVKGKEVGQFDCGGADFGVYVTEEGEYQYEIRSVEGTMCALMQCSADFRQATVSLVTSKPGLRAYGLNNAMMLAYTFATAPLGTLLMHSSVVRHEGKGYMFLGKSGTGKSTHTQLWLKYIPGCDLMNDDNPVLRVIDGQTIVYGSPWSGKTPCYRNIQAPVGGITMLQQKPENTMRREGVLAALSALLPSASNMKWERRIHSAILDTMQQVIASTPIYTLGCRPDEEAAQLSHATQCKSHC